MVFGTRSRQVSGRIGRPQSPLPATELHKRRCIRPVTADIRRSLRQAPEQLTATRAGTRRNATWKCEIAVKQVFLPCFVRQMSSSPRPCPSAGSGIACLLLFDPRVSIVRTVIPVVFCRKRRDAPGKMPGMRAVTYSERTVVKSAELTPSINPKCAPAPRQHSIDVGL